MTTPFMIFPWDRAFLPELRDMVVEQTCGRPGDAVIIVPHSRPRRYLRELFHKDARLPRPLRMPAVLTVSEAIGLFRAAETASPLRNAGTLDRVALLWRSVAQVSDTIAEDEESDLLRQRFKGMDMARFFPWGLRLAALLEECFTQELQPKDVLYTEGEVSPLASALLGALGRIHARYVTLLHEESWTTPGLDALMAANYVRATQGLDCIPQILRTTPSRHVFVAGLAVLSNAENALLHHLWQHGARICLHTDPALAHNARSHFACTDHVRWMQHWKADAEMVCPPTGRKPRLHFFAGYDAHSQLLAMSDVLHHKNDSTAIVLATSDLLMPVLHHLPDQDFNVSMGYPLERAPLYRLVEAALRLQMTRREGEDGSTDRYHWRALLQCLRHPYLHMLETGEGESLRTLFAHLENCLRKGTRFVCLDELLTIPLPPSLSASQAARELLQHTLKTMITAFTTVHTPTHMGVALGKLCDLLLQHGGDTWTRYPLDAESLYRIVRDVIPGLKDSSLADTPFPPLALFNLTRQLLRAERVPFEADPIAGLQVLGMLETRLLHFERLLILDATDDNLPGFTAQDPLLPDALRALLGLPDARRRERTAAHTLYRLMAGAEEVHFFWQEGLQRSALFDGKKSRSRFIDELVWQEEQHRKSLLIPGKEPLYVASCPVRPMPRSPQTLPSNPELAKKTRQLLEKGIAPTRLDTYLLCPLRFAWENLYQIRPLEEVNEDDDPAAVGSLIHEVLHDVYEEFKGQCVRQGQISPEALTARFHQRLDASDLRKQLPPDSYVMLSLAGPLRLVSYLEQQPAETRIMDLEVKAKAPLKLGDITCLLSGTLDRVDLRPDPCDPAHQRLVVLDYKTGKVQLPKINVWQNMDLWEAFPPCPSEEADLRLNQMADAFPSVQLPCYLYLCTHAPHLKKLGRPGNAALVELRDQGKELSLLGPEDEELRDTVLEHRIPQLLAFILRHMANTTHYVPRQGDHCTYCPYTALCRK